MTEPCFIFETENARILGRTGMKVYYDPRRKGSWVVDPDTRFVAVRGAFEGEVRSIVHTEEESAKQDALRLNIHNAHFIAKGLGGVKVGWGRQGATEGWCLIDLWTLGSPEPVADRAVFLPLVDAPTLDLPGKDVYYDSRRDGCWVVEPGTRFIAVHGAPAGEARSQVFNTERAAREHARELNEKFSDVRSIWIPADETDRWCVIDLHNLHNLEKRSVVVAVPSTTATTTKTIQVDQPPTDEELVAAFEVQQRSEHCPRSLTFRGTVFYLDDLRAAWSRVLRRKVKEAEEKRKLPCQGDWLEDHE